MAKESGLHPCPLDLGSLLDYSEAKKVTQRIMNADFENRYKQETDVEGKEKIEEETKRRIALLDKIYSEDLSFPLDKETQEDMKYFASLFDAKERRHKTYKSAYTRSQKGIRAEDAAHLFAQKNADRHTLNLEEVVQAKKCFNALIESIQIQAVKEGYQWNLIENLSLAASNHIIIERMKQGA